MQDNVCKEKLLECISWKYQPPPLWRKNFLPIIKRKYEKGGTEKRGKCDGMRKKTKHKEEIYL
jgi:hypothetical protein